MTKWLLNSAVLPAGAYGTYLYTSATVEDLRRFVTEGEFPISHIGYQQTADLIEGLTSVPIPLSRDPSDMKPGDVAMVVRLRYRVDPTQKGAPVSTKLEDWEIARLIYWEPYP